MPITKRVQSDILSAERIRTEVSEMKHTFAVVLTPDPDDGGYVVTVPALPGCITEGDTYEEALQNARDAITLYLEYMRDKGEPIDEVPPSTITFVEVG